MNKWINLIEKINERYLGMVILRSEIVPNRSRQCSEDTYRRYLTKAGYLGWHRRGVYYVLKHVNYSTTVRDVKREGGYRL